MSRQPPPRLAEALLRRLLGWGPDADSIVGDLHEEHRQISTDRTKATADLWYWSQLLGTGWRYARPDRASLERVGQDVRAAIRGFRREPGFTIAVVSTLALAIGAGTAIYSVVDAVVFRPLPFDDPDRLVRVWAMEEAGTDLHVDLMYPDLEAFAGGVDAFDATAMLSVAPSLMLDERGDNGEDVVVARTSTNLFETLGVEPAMGREISDEEAGAGTRVVLISHELWVRRFASDRAAVGRTVHLDLQGFEIVGVLPRGAAYPYEADVWRALAPAETQDDDREAQIIARLAPDATLLQANEQVSAVAAGLSALAPETHAGLGAWTQPFRTTVVREVSLALYALLAAVGLVLVIACVNTANLLIARSTRRGHEVAIRTALGAARGRILSQHLTESLLLAGLGGVAGVLLGRWALSVMLTVAPELPRLDSVGLDGRVLLVMVGVTALCGVLFGVGPALHAASTPPEETLRDGAHQTTPGRRKLAIQSGLVTTEVALSTVLAFLGLLLFSTFQGALTFDRGFELDGLVTVTVDPMHPPEDGDERRAYFGEVRDRVARLGAVRAASWSSHDVLEARGFRVDVAVESRAVPVPTPQAYVNVVSADFFATAGIVRSAGTGFSESGGVDGDEELIVNERFATLHLGAEPVGTRLELDWLEGHVVGVVRDVTVSPGEPPLPKVYVALDRVTVPGMALTVRTIDAPGLVVPDIERAIRAVSRDVLLEDVTIVQEAVRESVAPERFNMILVVIFAGLALSLAAVGIYGVTSLSVASRQAEIGIRRALGARSHDVAAQVTRRIATMTTLGIAVGLVAAIASGRIVSGLLFGVSPSDPTLLAVVALILGATAATACLVPIARAIRIDPCEALRRE